VIGFMRAVFNLPLTGFVVATAMALMLLPSGYSLAGPDTKDLSHAYPRPLKVVSHISNGIRFDVITPEEPVDILEDGEEASWYQDGLFIVRSLDTLEVLHIHPLNSYDGPEFLESDLLSGDYVLVNEWSGGASCCKIIHAFQTSPFKEILIGYDNALFDVEIVSKDQIALHVFNENGPNADQHPKFWEYSPQVFDLRTGEWQKK
jgi:hypothetical protein